MNSIRMYNMYVSKYSYKIEHEKYSHTVDFLEHGVHILEVVVIEEPNRIVVLILVERNFTHKNNDFNETEKHTSN